MNQNNRSLRNTSLCLSCKCIQLLLMEIAQQDYVPFVPRDRSDNRVTSAQGSVLSSGSRGTVFSALFLSICPPHHSSVLNGMALELHSSPDSKEGRSQAGRSLFLLRTLLLSQCSCSQRTSLFITMIRYRSCTRAKKVRMGNKPQKWEKKSADNQHMLSNQNCYNDKKRTEMDIM